MLVIQFILFWTIIPPSVWNLTVTYQRVAQINVTLPPIIEMGVFSGLIMMRVLYVDR